MKHFVVDLDICNGCYCCQIACKDEHVANDWIPYAKPQPDTGQFWVKLEETVRGAVPKVKVSYFPHMCMHCTEAQCMAACEEGGAIYRREDGLVIIDPQKCTGCKRCVDTCPYGAIYFNEDLWIAQKCTGCAHLLDDGWDLPRCVDACPTGALRYEEQTELKDLINKAEPINGEKTDQTLVHYINKPKRFVAGTVYDPVQKEVIIDAMCTLESKVNGEVFKAETDIFGDFLFDGLNYNHSYSLEIEKNGKKKSMKEIPAGKDVSLGDIAMDMS